MADTGASTSKVQSQTTPEQQQQHQQQQQQRQEASRSGRKRRLSMNRKKGNKKGPQNAADTEGQPNPLLELVITNLRSCTIGREMQTIVTALQPTTHDVAIALNMVKCDLQRVLAFPDNPASIYEFGSIKSGLLLKDSDLDFYIHYAQERNEREGQIKLIHVICGRMERDGAFTRMTKILGAKVPLLRTVHVRTNLQCDINFSNARGCYNSKFIFAVMQFDPRIHQLALTVKYWAHCAHILTIHKQMNSYCMVMMLIFFLQTRKLPVIPSVEDMQQGIHRINYGPWNLGYPQQISYKTWNVNTVRELLVSFFKYYSEFDFEKNLISPFVGRLCSLDQLEKKTIRELATYYRAIEREDYPEFSSGPFISIQDPFELNVNVGKVLRTKMLFEQMNLSFKHAYKLCLQHEGKEFSQLLTVLFSDTIRYHKPKGEKSSKNANAPSTSASTGSTTTGQPGSARVNGMTGSVAPIPASTGCWYMCRLPPIEYELFLVKEILLARDPGRKVIITNERVKQLWSECIADFIVDILRKLFMVKIEPIDDTAATATQTNDNAPDKAQPPAVNPEATTTQRVLVRKFQMFCERQVFISRKRMNITNEADLKREIEISKARWEKNHALQFSTFVDIATVDDGVELRIPNNQPKNGPLRLFIDTCFIVHIRKCLRGYFMVMLAKAKEKAQQQESQNESQTSGGAQVETMDTCVENETNCTISTVPTIDEQANEPKQETEQSTGTGDSNKGLGEACNVATSDDTTVLPMDKANANVS